VIVATIEATSEFIESIQNFAIHSQIFKDILYSVCDQMIKRSATKSLGGISIIRILHYRIYNLVLVES
jgi:hypothetical protein